MAFIGRLLQLAGRQGPALLVLSLLAGSIAPALAGAAYAALPASAFLLTLGSFLAAGLSPPERRRERRLIAAALAWIALAVPLAASAGAAWSGAAPALRTGIVLSFVAPPVGSAAAIAAMLSLRPRLALVVSLTLTILAPLAMPAGVGLAQTGAQLDVLALMGRLLTIVGLAAVIALAALRWRAAFSRLLPDAQAGSGVAVIGLVIVGLATTVGVRRFVSTDASGFLFYLALATVLNVLVCVVSAALFAGTGWRNALTVGLVSGNRNVTLVWAAAGPAMPPGTEAYIAACVVPILSLPLVLKLALALARPRLWGGVLAGIAVTPIGTAVAQSVPFAACAPVADEDRCSCSVRSVEVPLSFGDAATIINLYYREEGDEAYEALLGRLLRQCSFGVRPSPRRVAVVMRAHAP